MEFNLADDYKKAKMCRATVSKTIKYSNPQTYALQKNGPYNRIINRQ